MIKIFVDSMLGSIGRAIEYAYLNHAFQASLIMLVWMIVIIFGLSGVARMRRKLRVWVEEVLPQYDADNVQTPERILLALEGRWNTEAAQVRFMPTKRGLWTQRATVEGLKEHAGFTPAGIEQIITRITGRPQDCKRVAIDVAGKRSTRARVRQSTRARRRARA